MNQTQHGNLIAEISKVSFVMDDLRLFLDTHPDDEAAIRHYNECSKKRGELVSEYTRTFGPLMFYCPNDNASRWMWNDGPMPWEGVC
ncbi:MAG: spore coat protein CotJB [Lachnospiraceae bacterium]|nr:spore coat protein CotJB [Lachnospiraceae bacterium]